MAAYEIELVDPPAEERARELWLQHAVRKILFEDVRGYAVERIDPKLSPDARAAAQKGIDDALYGLMMVIDGVSGTLQNESNQVDVRLVARHHTKVKDDWEIVHQLDLFNGDGMCLGYHGWMADDYGRHPVARKKAG